jgi:hypothetical protein
LCTTFGLCDEAARPRCHSFNSRDIHVGWFSGRQSSNVGT